MNKELPEARTDLSNKRIVEICLSFMLGISVPTLIRSISDKLNGFLIWFFIVFILISMIGATIYFFLINDSNNEFFFIFEVTLIIYLTCWVYGVARIINFNGENHMNLYGSILTLLLFFGYGLWGLFYHKFEKNESWRRSLRKSVRVKFSFLSILFMILIALIQSSNLLK